MIDACRFPDVQVEVMTMICRDENLNAMPHLQRAYQGVEGGSRWWFQKMQMRHRLDDKGSLGPCPWLSNSHQITRWPKVAVLGCLFAYPGVQYLHSRCSALLHERYNLNIIVSMTRHMTTTIMKATRVALIKADARSLAWHAAQSIESGTLLFAPLRSYLPSFARALESRPGKHNTH